LGQSLTAVKANLVALYSHANGGRPQLEDCLRLVDEAIVNVRELSQLLRPTILDDFGLQASLRWLCDRFKQRTSIDVVFQSNLDERLADETETHLFRIAQEALTNVARHAAATRVEVSLHHTGGQVSLRVADNGKGLTTEVMGGSRGLGMVGMRARARSIGGELKVQSPGTGGVEILASFPFVERQETVS
jgi:signal transduction histidine kinase